MFYAALITALNERLQVGRGYLWKYRGISFLVALVEVVRAGWMSWLKCGYLACDLNYALLYSVALFKIDYWE